MNAPEANAIFRRFPWPNTRSLLYSQQLTGIKMRDFLKVTLKRITAALLAAVIYDIVSRSLYSETPPIAILGDPIPRFVLIFFVALILLSLIIRHFRDRREKLVSDNSPRSFVVKGKPDNVKYSIEMDAWGVKWEGLYGTNGRYREREPYVYVKDPICPHDDTLLSARKVSRFYIFTRRAWVCPRCDREYPRPRKHLFNEDSVMEDMMKRDIQRELQSGST